ncbi:hypothetical protein Kpol_1038p8 [Vanderwaltozyma polyspora DSM 70294]|uniref:DNA replication complex GINS protein PSF3 n=1 Tax=Vanderwaltozyma polyspora (strain ATCC 22028 / DSM 70294 / BCRC 21397 / CBS 2163 / NBRC 10782 / NRRL Y-8283 / UCD 57-17) TaxID=436907 RepID=A7TQZ9_VANPO|nr:uncharacterized protein Kpol_1038p8 [Vanderwaltozyma polyspora DSM 70294]EDO15302.1 hypothetical protein Kpol_1038p8 [Vanderwaltozyma polyspora DSM 70294]
MYYDIDDILADSAEIPCKFNYDIPGLGYLEGNPGKQINKNTKIQLPLWLARILAIIGGDSEGADENGDETNENDNLPFLEMQTPDFLSNKVINAIKTSPESLDLHSINSHFIELANKWIALFGDTDLANVIYDLTLARSIELNNHASSVALELASNKPDNSNKDSIYQDGNNINTPFLLSMDEFEKKIYKKSHNSYKDTKKWLFEP